jgi:hypothetical protein
MTAEVVLTMQFHLMDRDEDSFLPHTQGKYTKACVKTNIAITMEIKPGLGNVRYKHIHSFYTDYFVYSLVSKLYLTTNTFYGTSL